LYISGVKTSIALESVFWETIDFISEGDWRGWVNECLSAKPDGVGRAMFLRKLTHKYLRDAVNQKSSFASVINKSIREQSDTQGGLYCRATVNEPTGVKTIISARRETD
jgi:predicted DNA-binding ribbon-helix-helix protein